MSAKTAPAASATQPHAKPKRVLSERALEANRRNAQLSTGPKSEEGKATVRLNAARHRITAQVHILPPEEHAAVEDFCRPIAESYHPEGPEEIQLARGIAENYWRLNQVRAAITNRFALAAGTRDLHPMAGGHPEIGYALHVAQTFDRDADILRLITLYEQRTMNQLQKEKRELEALQKTREQKRQSALEEARLLYKTASAGEIWNPEDEAQANGGFVFSAPIVAAAIGRADRIRAARQAESGARALLSHVGARRIQPKYSIVDSLAA